MVLSSQEALSQIEDVLRNYPNLKVFESNEKNIRLKGKILIHRIVNDFTLYKEYSVDIYIPIDSEELPYLIDTENEIDSTYHHIYRNKILCLETEAKIRFRFINGFNLLEWMDEFVESYYVSYEYYMLYGEFPLGERSHGIAGVIEAYQDIFHVNSFLKVLKLMYYVRDNSYRGHLKCPCGSSKRLRSCHGKWLLPFFIDDQLKKTILSDLSLIERSFNETRKNYKQTK